MSGNVRTLDQEVVGVGVFFSYFYIIVVPQSVSQQELSCCWFRNLFGTLITRLIVIPG